MIGTNNSNGKDHTAKQTVVDTVRAKRTRVGEVVKNGIKWLITNQDAEGCFGGRHEGSA